MIAGARRFSQQSAGRSRSEPFPDAAAAWFWAVSALAARHQGANGPRGVRIARPCDPDDVINVADRLYRSGRLRPAHARVLKLWGERGIAPDAMLQSDRSDRLLWAEAMAMLHGPLSGKGIIGKKS